MQTNSFGFDHRPYRQRGAALLLPMLVVLIASSSVLLANLGRDELKFRQRTDTQQSLAEARNALINYALLNSDLNSGRSISLPCPDIDDGGGFAEGVAHTTACGVSGETVIGRLPWRTLDIPSLKDASAACLWYVVSGSYKDADASTAAMINWDSNGQLQLIRVTSGDIVAGSLAADRPAAIVFAAMQPVSSQTRPAVVAGSQCAPGAVATAYLDDDPATGVSNAVLIGVADVIDRVAVTDGVNEDHNDRVITVTRSDIARRLLQRPDFEPRMRSLGLAVAACLANYGANNPGGATDKRLPWPATVAMSDYRLNTAYDDAVTGFVSGRLPDIVDDSNATTGNSIARLLSDCDSVAVPQWTVDMQFAWQSWKDHFFYAVATSHSPSAATPSTCTACLTVNGSGQYAAVLMYASERLNTLGQVRDAPPTDSDTKQDVSNYLEASNLSNVPGPGTALDYASGTTSATFNDLIYCIDDQLIVTEC